MFSIIIKTTLVIIIIAGVSLLLYLFSGLLDCVLRNIHYKDTFIDNILFHIENVNDVVLFFSNKVFEIAICIVGVEVVVAAVICFIYWCVSNFALF